MRLYIIFDLNLDEIKDHRTEMFFPNCQCQVLDVFFFYFKSCISYPIHLLTLVMGEFFLKKGPKMIWLNSGWISVMQNSICDPETLFCRMLTCRKTHLNSRVNLLPLFPESSFISLKCLTDSWIVLWNRVSSASQYTDTLHSLSSMHCLHFVLCSSFLQISNSCSSWMMTTLKPTETCGLWKQRERIKHQGILKKRKNRMTDSQCWIR